MGAGTALGLYNVSLQYEQHNASHANCIEERHNLFKLHNWGGCQIFLAFDTPPQMSNGGLVWHPPSCATEADLTRVVRFQFGLFFGQLKRRYQSQKAPKHVAKTTSGFLLTSRLKSTSGLPRSLHSPQVAPAAQQYRIWKFWEFQLFSEKNKIFLKIFEFFLKKMKKYSSKK